MAKHREVRLRALGDALSTCEYDLICLQEIWVQGDFQYVQAKVRHILPYSHYYFAGFLGSGLAIFSRWPIFGTSMFQFSLCGRPAAIWRGDWYAGKGIATALIRHHTGAVIEVFNTHVYPYIEPFVESSFMPNMGRAKTRTSVIELRKLGRLQSSSVVPLSEGDSLWRYSSESFLNDILGWRLQ